MPTLSSRRKAALSDDRNWADRGSRSDERVRLVLVVNISGDLLDELHKLCITKFGQGHGDSLQPVSGELIPWPILRVSAPRK